MREIEWCLSDRMSIPPTGAVGPSPGAISGDGLPSSSERAEYRMDRFLGALITRIMVACLNSMRIAKTRYGLLLMDSAA